MAPFLYRCPNMGVHVQGWRADDLSAVGDTFESVVCAACRQLHLVNAVTGKVLGEAEDEDE
jgi:hypothetical protein